MPCDGCHKSDINDKSNNTHCCQTPVQVHSSPSQTDKELTLFSPCHIKNKKNILTKIYREETPTQQGVWLQCSPACFHNVDILHLNLVDDHDVGVLNFVTWCWGTRSALYCSILTGRSKWSCHAIKNNSKDDSICTKWIEIFVRNISTSRRFYD